MGFLVHVLNRIGSDTILNEARKLAFEGLFLFLEALHVISYMLSKDVSSVNISTELTSLFVISWEPLLTVGDIKTTISCTFHGSKNLGTSGSSGQTHVQTGTEGSGAISIVFNHVMLTIDLGITLVSRVQIHLLQDPSCQEKTSTVGCSIVGQTNFDSIVGQFMAVSSSHNSISLEASISDLTSDVFVGTSHNHTILGCIVLVLVLDDKALTGIIVGFAFTSPPKLHLVTLEISFTFDHFDKRHDGRFHGHS